MRQSIFQKIWLTNAFLIAFVLAVLSVFVFLGVRDHYLSLKTEHLKTALEGLRSEVTSRLSAQPSISKNNVNKTNASRSLQSWIHTAGERMNLRITLIDENGVVLADSMKSPEFMENHSDRPELKISQEEGFGSSLRYSYTLQARMLYLAILLQPGNTKHRYYLRGSLFLKEIDELSSDLELKILLIVLILLFLSLSLSAWLTKNLTTPIKELMTAAASVAAGNFNINIHSKGNDEIATLSLNFKMMVERIQSLFQEAIEKKEEMHNLIASIHDSILLIDRTGLIRIANKSVYRLLGVSSLEGRQYWEVIRLGQLNTLIRGRLNLKDEALAEIQYRERFLDSKAKYLPDVGHVLVVLHDITEYKHLEQIKKDLIANVSHELRTPLTAIKGYVETLRDEYPGAGEKYLSIVEKHTDRLIFMVRDLLTLSKLERPVSAPSMEQVELSTVLQQIAFSFEKQAADKKIQLIKEIDSGIIIRNSDQQQIEQLVINLIDNAIKYTEQGSVTITLKQITEENTLKICLQIKDTGIGIAEKNLTRIFERFYVVDPSRSRNHGGTGLGLSIVKHIAQNLDATIELVSQPGKGTQFTVLFSS